MAVLEVSSGRLRESFYNSIWLENKTVIFKVIAYEKVNSSPIFPSLVFKRDYYALRENNKIFVVGNFHLVLGILARQTAKQSYILHALQTSRPRL